jgi:hypothetical protein
MTVTAILLVRPRKRIAGGMIAERLEIGARRPRARDGTAEDDAGQGGEHPAIEHAERRRCHRPPDIAALFHRQESGEGARRRGEEHRGDQPRIGGELPEINHGRGKDHRTDLQQYAATAHHRAPPG